VEREEWLNAAAARLRQDLAATVGPLNLAVTFEHGGVSVRTPFFRSWRVCSDEELLPVALIKAAEQVQQYLHDEHIHTTWPTCPFHRTHPLWAHIVGDDVVWRCERTGRIVCAVGELSG
jgi:hypothetical protein